MNYDDAERELYRQSLYHFGKFCLGYDLMVPHLHGKMCRVLQSESPHKLLCVPRGTFKSSLGSVVYPIWRIIQNPNIRILIDSELYSNATNYLREIKGHFESNERFRRLFGDYVGSIWNESEIIVSKRDKVKKEATITASGIGAQKTGQHYDLIIGDDLSSTDNTATIERAQKVITHYRLYTSLLDPGGEKVIIGTRYSELDIIGHIIENELGIEKGDINELKRIYGGDWDKG